MKGDGFDQLALTYAGGDRQSCQRETISVVCGLVDGEALVQPLLCTSKSFSLGSSKLLSRCTRCPHWPMFPGVARCPEQSVSPAVETGVA